MASIVTGVFGLRIDKISACRGVAVRLQPFWFVLLPNRLFDCIKRYLAR